MKRLGTWLLAAVLALGAAGPFKITAPSAGVFGYSEALALTTAPLNVLSFGAKGDGVADDTTAIQAAITLAQATGNQVYLPAASYLISSTLTFSKSVRFYGDGWRSILLVKSTVGAATDILKVSPSASDDTQSGFIFEDFRIKPQSGTPGRHALAIDIATRAVYSVRVRGVRFDALGGRGIVTLPNATPLTDGFFTSVIEQSTIANGIYLDKAGDSIRILNNTLTGANAGVYADLVFVGVATKAQGLDIIGNNVSTSGGGVLIKSAWAARIARNLFETSAGTANNAVVDIDGTDATNRPGGVDVYSNVINTPAGVDAVRVNFARMAQIRNNMCNEPGGGGFCWRVTANAADTQILFNPTSADSTITTQLADAGARTNFFRHGLTTGSVELTRDLFLIGSDGRLRGKDTAGTGIAIAGLNIADNTVKLGAIDVPASNGHVLLYAGGAEVARGNPTSLTFQTVSKIYPGTDAGARQSAAGIYGGTGAPNNANGSNGDFYFRSDGGAGTSLYMKRAGAWVGIL